VEHRSRARAPYSLPTKVRFLLCAFKGSKRNGCFAHLTMAQGACVLAPDPRLNANGALQGKGVKSLSAAIAPRPPRLPLSIPFSVLSGDFAGPDFREINPAVSPQVGIVGSQDQRLSVQPFI